MYPFTLQSCEAIIHLSRFSIENRHRLRNAGTCAHILTALHTYLDDVRRELVGARCTRAASIRRKSLYVGRYV